MRTSPLMLHLLIPFGLLMGMIMTGCTAAEQGTRYQDLVLRIKTNRTRANVGDQVQIHFTVTNDGKQPVRIHSEGRPVLDVQVVDVNSHEVLLSWAAQHPDQASTDLVWQPGETKTIDVVWTPTEKGFYEGRTVGLAGSLSKGAEVVQGASIIACLGGCDR